jgi:hypothetical protein
MTKAICPLQTKFKRKCVSRLKLPGAEFPLS